LDCLCVNRPLFSGIVILAISEETICLLITHHAIRPGRFLCNPDASRLVRGKRTDHDVVSVRISQCELHSSSVRVHLGFLLEAIDESTCPWQRYIEIIDTEKQ